MLASPPPPTAACEEARYCWNWLGGWHPERIGVYLTFHACADVHGLMERLLAIRERLDEEAQKPARKAGRG